MWEIEDDIIIETTRKGNTIYQAKVGLLKDKYWRYLLKDYPIDLLCVIRKALEESIPLLVEKANTRTHGLVYFAYKVRNRDAARNDFSKRSYGTGKAKIFIRKKNLCIDLDIDRKFEQELREAGYAVKYSNNFQGRGGWLTGWHVPHSTKDVQKVMKWILMAFKR